MIDSNIWDGSIPTVAFDMDGTLYKWGVRLNEILLELDPNFPIIDDEARTDFSHFSDGSGRQEIIDQAMAHDRFYDSLEPYDGAIQAVKDTYAAGYLVIFLSTPSISNPMCMANKAEQIRKDFGEEAVKHLILSHDKTIVNTDILVDDKPTITGYATPTWTRIMADHSWNRGIPTPLRLTDWSEWPVLLEEALHTRRSEITTGR